MRVCLSSKDVTGTTCTTITTTTTTITTNTTITAINTIITTTINTTITTTTTETRAFKVLSAFCGPGIVLNVYLFNPHSNVMLSLKIRKGRPRESRKFCKGNTVKCRVMLLAINFSYFREDKDRKTGES